MIRVHHEPGVVKTWEEFVATAPDRAIALDGYVTGAPRVLSRAHRFVRSFNHHEDVDRSCTASTCGQVWRALHLGMTPRLRDDGEPDADVFVNDADEDVALATWLLHNPDRASEPLVRDLVHVEDLLDMSGGLFPVRHDDDVLAKIRWTFAPCFRLKTLGDVQPDDLSATLCAVHGRISAFAIGRAGSLAVDESFQVVEIGHGWVLSRTASSFSRPALVKAGHMAGVEYIPLGNERYRYTVWRLSEYVEFPVVQILRVLSDVEPGWGGSGTIGGSPRGGGSALPPRRVFELVQDALASLDSGS